MSLDFTKLNWLAIGVVCLGTFFLGGFWYTVLGPMWIKFHGWSPERVAAMKTLRPPGVFFGGMIASYAIFAIFLAVVVHQMQLNTLVAGVLAGMILWLAIALPIGLTNWIASDTHFGVYVIDLSYQLIFMTAATGVLAAWR